MDTILNNYPLPPIYLRDYKNKNGKRVKKKLGHHTDITHNKRTGKPMSQNCQVPGSPVALLTCGSTKNLWFRRFRGKESKLDSTTHIHQKSGCLFVLDGRDEIPNKEGWQWKHMADMADPDGITFTYTFRSLETWACSEVNPDGTLTNPDHHMTENRKRRFQEADKAEIFNQPECTEMRTLLESRMAEFLCLTDLQEATQPHRDGPW